MSTDIGIRFTKYSYKNYSIQAFYPLVAGVKMAYLHMKVVLSMILREYEIWQLDENKVILDTRSTFTVAINGVKLHFKEIVKSNDTSAKLSDPISKGHND